MAEEPRAIRHEHAALLAIVALAGALRLIHADNALWYDEIYTLVNFVRLPTAELVASYDSLNNHMLYSLLAQLSIGVLGESSLALRLPAILLGLGSIVVAWLLARRALGAAGALVVALLLALSYHHVWFSQNARGYTGLLFLTGGATLAFLRGLERPTFARWSAYALWVTAAMYTHLSAGFFFVAHGVVYLWIAARAATTAQAGGLRSRTVWMPAFGIGLSVVLTLLLYAPIIGQALRTIGEVSEASNAAGGAALAEWLSPWRAVQEIGRSIAGMGPLVPVILAGALVVLGAGTVTLFRRQPVMTAIYVLSIPLTVVLLLIAGVRIWPRYFLVDIGFIFIAIVEGVFVWSALLARWLRQPSRWIAGAGVVAMVLVSVALLVRNYAHPKQDFIGARDYVVARAAPGDRIAAIGLAGYAYKALYAPRWTVVDTASELEGVRSAHGPAATWLVMTVPHQTLGSRPGLEAYLAKRFDKVATLPGTLGDGAMWIYRSRGEAAK